MIKLFQVLLAFLGINGIPIVLYGLHGFRQKEWIS
jgi:hypothetical protein